MRDLIVIGGGPAGTSGAFAAAVFGQKVTLIEACPELGGAGLNTGTIPSKTLRESALLLSGAKSRKLLGIQVARREEASLREFTYHERHVVETGRTLVTERARRLGVEVVHGLARFTSPNEVAIEQADGTEQRLQARKFLIATGSKPTRPPEYDFSHPRVHDSDEILNIHHMPTSLTVVGAGVIGTEYASTFAALGIPVHVIDGRKQLLPFLDRELGDALHQAMVSNGITFHFQEQVLRCEPRFDSVRLQLSSGREIVTSDVLVAAGRQCATDRIGLDVAGVKVGNRGIIPVNEHFQTSVPHIYAAGDVIGPPAIAATAMEYARIAMMHAFGGINKRANPIQPTGIYSIPESACVGATEEELAARQVPYVVGRSQYRANPRGRIIGEESGFLKVIFDKRDMRLLGVHILGESAIELIHVGLLAIQCEQTAYTFDSLCFNYPTLTDLYKAATYDALLQTMNLDRHGLFGDT
jgi:NAD(P) transhydrogenase